MSPARLLAQLTLRKLVHTDFSPTAAWKQLTTLGISYRKQDVFRDWHHYDDIRSAVEVIDGINPWDIIPQEDLVETVLKRDRLYRVYGYSDFYNPDTGLTDRVFTSFYSDQGVNEIEWSSEFMEQYTRKWGEEYGREMLGFETVYVEHNQGMPYNTWEELREL